MKPCPRRVGFSLIELLVVVGLIALLAGGLGLALNDTGGNALATSQTTLATMLGQARAQAAVQQTRTRLYVYGSRPPAGEADKFLRLVQVYREEPFDSGRYIPTSPPVSLPRGVYIVPPSTAGFLAPGVVWLARPAPVSAFVFPQPRAILPAQLPASPFGTALGYYIEFSPEGEVLPNGAKLAVATATLANNQPQFNNANAVRGLLLRPTGAVTFVNDRTGF